MDPRLPPNSMTITPSHRVQLTADGVVFKYRGRMLTKELREEALKDMDVLRAWDNYERTTAPGREAAKRLLQRIIDQITP